MMSLCDGWGWQYLKLLPPSILDIYKVFEHIDILSICAVNWHTVAALNSCTHTPRRCLLPCLHCRPCHAGVGSHHAGIINCAGIVTLFVLATLPSLCWCYHPWQAGVVALVALVLSLVCGMVYHIFRSLVHAISTRAKMPANWLHNASTTRAEKPVQQGQ
jgi:hypothetical protein